MSLAQLDPLALRDLVQTGECVFNLSEKLFDDDYPGHYGRATAASTRPRSPGPCSSSPTRAASTGGPVDPPPGMVGTALP
ncbi:hypothetical protein [Dactylosporangium sp. NPDC050588]|uniref:Tc toxin subunit A-related protein n=1 Tax=Dactylosporangium sp. NPDC050588 TaxID=3157211 RepID=UPI0033DBF333